MSIIIVANKSEATSAAAEGAGLGLESFSLLLAACLFMVPRTTATVCKAMHNSCEPFAERKLANHKKVKRSSRKGHVRN